jgi:acetoin utilization deacetylase AcuC-like enzyme
MLQPSKHFEEPETKRRFHNLLSASGYLDKMTKIAPRYATEAEIAMFHTPDYITRVKEASERGGGDLGFQAVSGPGSFEIASLAVGGCFAAVDAILDPKNATPVRHAYALVRPPGHHAESYRGMGYCIFNNNALAVRYAQKKHGIKRAVLLDWDVHHGNGCQECFYHDKDVLYISIHQRKNYPTDTGEICENGAGEGLGFNINIPLPPGSGQGAYSEAFFRIIMPAIQAFGPEMIFISSGYDASFFDPLASMMLCSTDFKYFTSLAKAYADKHCGGKLFIVHEGGYSKEVVPFCGLAVLEELTGIPSGVSDPFAPEIAGLGEQELQPHQEARIKECETLVETLRMALKATKPSA